MQKVKFKILITLGIFIIISLLGTLVYASNENIQIIKESESRYLIYINNNLEDSFDFAFSNDKEADKSTLTYLSAAKDSSTEENYIAYINEYTAEHNYIWAKKADGTYFLEAIELDLTKAITAEELENVQNITKVINVDTTKNHEFEEIVDGTRKTLTIGKIEILEQGNFKYQIVKVVEGTKQATLMDLAERISKFNNSTDMYTKLSIYNQFNNLYKEMTGELLEEKWQIVQNNTILQPEEADNGTKYIVWIKKEADTTGQEILDAQFLTCRREYVEEKIIEQITTKLPVTYDNNILLIILGITVIAIIAVSLRIKSLKKKENN